MLSVQICSGGPYKESANPCKETVIQAQIQYVADTQIDMHAVTHKHVYTHTHTHTNDPILLLGLRLNLSGRIATGEASPPVSRVGRVGISISLRLKSDYCLFTTPGWSMG